MYTCFNCGAAWDSSLRQPAVKETCEGCGAYLHCCRNCTYHRQGYPNACYIPDTEKIADRRRANFCDEFEFISVATREKRAGAPKQGDATLAALLGEGSDTLESTSGVKEWLGTSDKTPEEFDDLFED